MMRIFALLAALVIPCAATPAGLADFSNRDVVAALKEALTKSSDAAVSRLGIENGFFGDERVKILLPDSLKRAERVMSSIGMGRQADDLMLRMNRAAEAAVPEARTLLVDAVRKMSIQDAKSVLTGGDDAATQYFKRTTSGPLTQKFLPKVKDAMSRVRLAETYDAFAERGRRLGLVKDADANLEDYITRKALDGLFLVMAEEEKKIRQDPIGTASGIIKKVFGALRN